MEHSFEELHDLRKSPFAPESEKFKVQNLFDLLMPTRRKANWSCQSQKPVAISKKRELRGFLRD